MAVPLASIGDSFSSFFDAVGDFVVEPRARSTGWRCCSAWSLFIGYLSVRARASFNILRAAYPDERIRYRNIWGAYLAGYGFNSVVPARGGDVVRLFLTKTSVPNSSYPAVASSFFVEQIFDLTMAIPILLFAFTQGAFPKPPDFSKLPAFDLAFFASHPRFTLFLLTVAGDRRARRLRAAVGARARVLGARAPGPDDPVRPPALLPRGLARPARRLGLRFTAFWCLLDARSTSAARCSNVLLVLGVNAVAALVPFTPGGAGVQQALLVKVFAGTAAGATVAAYSVGQQIAIGATTFACGFAAIVFIFRFRSFKEVIAAGREARTAPAEPRAPA